MAITNGWAAEANRKLEEALMKSYNRKHRPVKKDSTTMQIQIYLLIGHIEKVVLFLVLKKMLIDAYLLLACRLTQKIKVHYSIITSTNIFSIESYLLITFLQLEKKTG